jgi:lysophospholipase L1-like esterase
MLPKYFLLTETPRMRSRSRNLLFASIVVLIAGAASLAVAEIGLRYYAGYVQAQEQMDPDFLVYDDLLGWLMAPDWSGRHVHYDFDARYTTNAAGLRGGNWPIPVASAGERIVFLGDSFTFGLGVNDGETFVQVLQTADTDNTYFNAGIAGYSTDQQLLYLSDRVASWRIDRLVLVVYLANDLLDNELSYPLQATMGKPLFRAGPTGIKLTNVPVPRVSKPAEVQAYTLTTAVLGSEMPRSWRNNDWQLTRVLGLSGMPDPELLAGMPDRLTGPLNLFTQLVAEIRELCGIHDVALSIVLMPGRSFVEMPDSLSAQYQDYLRHEILARDAELGVPLLDLATALREQYAASGERLFFPNEGHLNQAGHRAAAGLLGAGE